MVPPTPPGEWATEVSLNDGTPVLIRPITVDDREALEAFHEGLSSRTIYLRFFSAHPHLTESDLDYFTGVDHVRRVALVALVRGELVGVGRFDVLNPEGAGRRDAEVAFVVADRFQRQGLGRLLLARLSAVARSLGVSCFVAEVLPANLGMLETFRHSGFPVTERHVDDVVEVSFPIAEA